MTPDTTAPTFTVEFSLTVTVKGASLQDIDNGLVQAAGQRLAARMNNPPRLNGVDVLAPAKEAARPVINETVTRHEPVTGGSISPATPAPSGPVDTGSAEPAATKGKRGVKPGTTRGPYKKTPAEEAAEVAAALADNSAEIFATPPASQPPAASAPPVAPPQSAAVPTLEQCVAALTKVNTLKNTDIAYKCLTDMGVKRCGEIPETRRAEFIAKCEAAAS